MLDVSWTMGHRFRALERGDPGWRFAFSDDVSLLVECPWRLLEGGRIRLSADDDGQRFGLPAPVDAAAELTRRLAGLAVRSVYVRPGVLDLSLTLEGGHVLEVLPVSSGYEAGQLVRPRDGSTVVACGRGELALHGASRRDPEGGDDEEDG